MQFVTRVREFFKEVLAEFRRVNWPSRQELANSTVVVLVVTLVVAFFLIGLASEQATSTAAEAGNKSTLFLALIVGLIVLCAGVVLVAPTCLALLARAAQGTLDLVLLSPSGS